ncbi:uncharacterized protein MONBRDRAFT_22697, partial [Monosiga brevicollis MX1]
TACLPACLPVRRPILVTVGRGHSKEPCMMEAGSGDFVPPFEAPKDGEELSSWTFWQFFLENVSLRASELLCHASLSPARASSCTSFAQCPVCEPLLAGLIAFHLLCFMIILTTKRFQTFQLLFGTALGCLVLCAEQINEYGALHWEELAQHQYFDSYGFFISIVFSLPILLNCLLLVIIWVTDASGMLVSLKRQQLLARRAATAKAQAQLEPEAEAEAITPSPEAADVDSPSSTQNKKIQ